MSEQSDRELLQQAAKVAGIDFKHGYTSDIGYLYFPPKEVYSPHAPAGRFWNPLTDDGDAQRLAVKLGIQLNPAVGGASEAYSDARRAIVRAAAEIGRAK